MLGGIEGAKVVVGLATNGGEACALFGGVCDKTLELEASSGLAGRIVWARDEVAGAVTAANRLLMPAMLQFLPRIEPMTIPLLPPIPK